MSRSVEMETERKTITVSHLSVFHILSVSQMEITVRRMRAVKVRSLCPRVRCRPAVMGPWVMQLCLSALELWRPGSSSSRLETAGTLSRHHPSSLTESQSTLPPLFSTTAPLHFSPQQDTSFSVAWTWDSSPWLADQRQMWRWMVQERINR